jgi:hypothetical protein
MYILFVQNTLASDLGLNKEYNSRICFFLTRKWRKQQTYILSYKILPTFNNFIQSEIIYDVLWLFENIGIVSKMLHGNSC